jgi:hypothetical protein
MSPSFSTFGSTFLCVGFMLRKAFPR